MLLILKSKIAHMPGFHLLNGRWHRLSPELHGAGAQHSGKHLTDDEWGQLYLPEDNANARTHNPALKKLREMSEAGDIDGILSQGVGTNTYGKRYSKIANHLLERHGVAHRVTPGQKAGQHPAVAGKQTTSKFQKNLFDGSSNLSNNNPMVTKQPGDKMQKLKKGTFAIEQNNIKDVSGETPDVGSAIKTSEGWYVVSSVKPISRKSDTGEVLYTRMFLFGSLAQESDALESQAKVFQSRVERRKKSFAEARAAMGIYDPVEAEEPANMDKLTSEWKSSSHANFALFKEVKPPAKPKPIVTGAGAKGLKKKW